MNSDPRLLTLAVSWSPLGMRYGVQVVVQDQWPWGILMQIEKARGPGPCRAALVTPCAHRCGAAADASDSRRNTKAGDTILLGHAYEAIQGSLRHPRNHASIYGCTPINSPATAG